MNLLPIKPSIEVQREQVRLLYAQGRIIQLLGIFSSLIVVLIYWDVINHQNLLIWFCANVVIYIIRLFYVSKFKKISVNNFNIEKWKNKYIISTFISGIVWGSLALFLDPSWPSTHQVALFIIYTGIIAGAFNSNSPVFISYVAFYLPPVLMLMYTILRQSNELFYELVFLITVYIILMYVTSLKYHNHLTRSLELRYANEQLVDELQIANKKLILLSEIDELSQIHNRRSMNKFLTKSWEWHYKCKQPISILVIDIDFFKQYNDSYGHLKGDECILEIAKILEKNTRSELDLAARYGGEEFVVILHKIQEIEALNIAQRISSDLLSKQIKHQSSEVSEYLTLSIGLACMVPTKIDNQTKFFDLADTRLYKAKQNGRNQIVYC
ncbi:MAG: GGDEF domain-containing protein [Thiovulaceae bacterium]|nr:GGDEF domain-containing protein [Sulfurimonadaceae bacterium]